MLLMLTIITTAVLLTALGVKAIIKNFLWFTVVCVLEANVMLLASFVYAELFNGYVNTGQ